MSESVKNRAQPENKIIIVKNKNATNSFKLYARQNKIERKVIRIKM